MIEKYCIEEKQVNVNGFLSTRTFVHLISDYENGSFRLNELCVCERRWDAERIVEALKSQEKASVKDGEA